MASDEAAKVTLGGNIVEDSATTVEIKIKTLDSQTYTLRVDKCVCGSLSYCRCILPIQIVTRCLPF